MTEEDAALKNGLNHEMNAALVQTLAANWRIVPPTGEAQDAEWEFLLEALAERILHLLRNNQQKLMSALYILDIPERRYTDAMKMDSMDERARGLAVAILERETEKIVSRKRYATRPASQPNLGTENHARREEESTDVE